jgi:hypothetical protein
MVRLNLESPLRAWRPGDYPLQPFIRITAEDDSGSVLASSHLATSGEIDHFLSRVVFQLKVLPKQTGQLRDEAKRELRLQGERILDSVRAGTARR